MMATTTWDDVCSDPLLQDLPYKIELNRDGEIIMDAVQVIHAFYVSAFTQVIDVTS